MKELLKGISPRDRDWALAAQIDPQRLPAHIAIIMDGNGRWAKKRHLPRLFGHREGVNTVRTITEACANLGVEVLTLYAFSVENWKRPKHEVDGLLRLLRTYLRREVANLIENDVQLTAIGRIDLLPQAVQDELQYVSEQTGKCRGMRLNLALNYGGRAELVDAVNALIANARLAGEMDTLSVSEEQISAHLYTAGTRDPDLLIRTSGEMRISNFLLWQIAYAELYVTETLWPDFSRTELIEAVLDYQSRDRRFGGITSEQPMTIALDTLVLQELEVPSH